ncbi:SDR family oxidoreductase [soil metagenome]
MRVLVTGSDGYLGSLLVPYLAARGHTVTGLDTGYYRSGLLYGGDVTAEPTITKDVRAITEGDLAGTEAVVHMAELSNDPLGQLLPEVTHDINHEGSVRLARACKAAGVERFVYTSSCSVYGVASEAEVDEESPTNPQTAYALCKALVERDVAALANESFSPTFLRNATAYGASPSMRFDIVLNNLAGLAWVYREIRMISDGSPWRPLVHALDICKAITCVLDAPSGLVCNEILNVGDTAQNYRIREIAEIVAETFPGCSTTYGPRGGDNRSYRVSFGKIKSLLPPFVCEWDAPRGAAQLRELFSQIGLTEELFTGRAFTRLKQLEHLLATGRLDSSLYWRT